MMDDKAKDLLVRINDYLERGGFWNPEMANHDAVRDMIIECRAVIVAECTARMIAESEGTAARDNFHTMQQAANKLRIAKENAEAKVSRFRESEQRMRERAANLAKSGVRYGESTVDLRPESISLAIAALKLETE